MLSASAVFTLNLAVTSMSYAADAMGVLPLTKFAMDGASERSAFTATPTVLYIRRDRNDRHRVANVFDEQGNKIYTIERRTMFSPIWSMYTAKDRIETASIRIGYVHRSVDFHTKPGMRHRDYAFSVGSAGKRRQFYLNDGAPYEWSRASKYLERVINPGGGDEEIRERVAQVRLMRQLRFDFELLIDESQIDLEVALTTGYIAMNTLWGIGEQVETQSPTRTLGMSDGSSEMESIADREVNMVYEDDMDSSENGKGHGEDVEDEPSIFNRDHHGIMESSSKSVSHTGSEIAVHVEQVLSQ